MRSMVAVCLLWAVLLPAARGEAGEAFYAELLPADTIAVISASDPAGFFEEAAASELGRLIGADEGLSSALKDKLRQAQAIASLVTNLPADQQAPLLEGGCAVAILPSPGGEPGVQRLPFVVLVDVSKLGEEARTKLERSLMVSAALVLREKASVERLADHVYEVALGEAPDQRFAVAFGETAIIAGNRADVARVPAGQPLAGEQWYREVAEQITTESGLGGYVNIDGLIGELNRRRPDLQRIERLKQLGVGDLAAFGFRTSLERGAVTDTLVLAMRRPRISWMRFLPAEQSTLRGARFVPPDFDLYVSVDPGRGDEVWDSLRLAIGEAAGPEALERLDNWTEGIEMPFGVSLRDDIFGSMAGEFFLAMDLDRLSEAILDEGIEAEKTPYLIGFRAARQEALGRALGRVLESEVVWGHLGIEKNHYEYGGYDLVKLSSYIEPRILHGFGFVDDYFLFSPRHQTVERAVDAYRGGACLAADGGFSALKQRMAGKANIEAFVRTSVLYRELLAAYGPWIGEPAQGVVQKFQADIERLGDSMASVSIREEGVTGRVCSPLGLGLGVVSAGRLKVAAVRRKVALTREILEKTAAAVDRYCEVHKTYPTRLDMLVPELLPEVPADPFAEYAGMPVRYDPGPRTMQDRQGVHATAYVVAANGPNRKQDFDVRKFDPAGWARKLKSADDAAVAELKAWLYQFRTELYADEQQLEDEGDIVVVRGSQNQEGDRR